MCVLDRLQVGVLASSYDLRSQIYCRLHAEAELSMRRSAHMPHGGPHFALSVTNATHTLSWRKSAFDCLMHSAQVVTQECDCRL